MNPEKYYLYILQCERYTKIGYTGGTVRDRITGIRSSNPFPLHLLCVMEFEEKKAVLYVERNIHKLFKECSAHGEWFLLTQAQINIIKKSFKDNIIEDFGYPIKETKNHINWVKKQMLISEELEETKIHLQEEKAKNSKLNRYIKKVKKVISTIKTL